MIETVVDFRRRAIRAFHELLEKSPLLEVDDTVKTRERTIITLRKDQSLIKVEIPEFIKIPLGKGRKIRLIFPKGKLVEFPEQDKKYGRLTYNEGGLTTSILFSYDYEKGVSIQKENEVEEDCLILSVRTFPGREGVRKYATIATEGKNMDVKVMGNVDIKPGDFVRARLENLEGRGWLLKSVEKISSANVKEKLIKSSEKEFSWLLEEEERVCSGVVRGVLISVLDNYVEIGGDGNIVRAFLSRSFPGMDQNLLYKKSLFLVSKIPRKEGVRIVVNGILPLEETSKEGRRKKHDIVA